jgi:hypothetical protein
MAERSVKHQRTLTAKSQVTMVSLTCEKNAILAYVLRPFRYFYDHITGFISGFNIGVGFNNLI